MFPTSVGKRSRYSCGNMMLLLPYIRRGGETILNECVRTYIYRHINKQTDIQIYKEVLIFAVSITCSCGKLCFSVW